MEKSITLYEMTNDLVSLMDEEISEEAREEIIEVIKLQMEAKAENIIAVIRNYETRIDGIKAEEKRRLACVEASNSRPVIIRNR